MSKFLNYEGLTYLISRISGILGGKVDKQEGKMLSSNDYTDPEKSKLAGVEENANAYVHPEHAARARGLYKVTVDAQGHVSDAEAVVKGDITGLGIPAQDTTYGPATAEEAGLMSAADKAKLDAVEAGANAYVHPDYTARESGLYKVAVDARGHVSGAVAVGKSDITGLGIPAQDTTYVPATAGEDGLMSAADKAKLDAVAAGANAYVHPAYTARESGLYRVAVDDSGHVSNAAEVVKSDITALGIPGQDTTYDPATAEAAGLMSAADKAKLDAVEAGANAYVHPAYTAWESGLYKVTVDERGHVSTAAAVGKADITALGIPGQDTTYPEATDEAAGLMTAADKAKLDNIAAGANAYVHPGHTAMPSGLYRVTVDDKGHVSAAVAAVKADITALGIPGEDTTYSPATQSTDGLMSASDKGKLDGIDAGANAYTHPVYPERTAGLYKVTVDGKGHVSQAAAVSKADITALGIPEQDTTYSAATGSIAGLMSAADKNKLDAFGTADTYALKTDLTSLYRFRGSVETENDLPEEAEVGDVYDVLETDMNYAYNGSWWDALGQPFTLESISTGEIDALFGNTNE